MVTNWEEHWDRLPNNETSYSLGMLKKGVQLETLIENTPTTFIKINKISKEPEGAWEGYTYDFRVQQNVKVLFKAKITREIAVPSAYQGYKEGWYQESEEAETIIPLTEEFEPPFIQILETTTDWKQFEDYTFFLLKLIGIHEIHKYENQKGQADGFFLIKNLAVIYDCTLEKHFEQTKAQQIENYCGQLSDGKIMFNGLSRNVSSHQKQVWIITKGTLRKFRDIDGIPVK